MVMDTTPQASERSIAEIIGWERKTESWPEVNYGGPADKPYKQVTRDYWEAPDGEEREPTVDDMLAWLHARGWAISHTWLNRLGDDAGRLTAQFMDPDKYPPEMRATWPADRFQSGHRRRGDPVETGRGWWNFTGASLLEIFQAAVRQCAEGAR